VVQRPAERGPEPEVFGYCPERKEKKEEERRRKEEESGRKNKKHIGREETNGSGNTQTW
jgi:hypothetical protein